MSSVQPQDASANIAAITRRIRNIGRIQWMKAVESLSDPGESFLCETCSRLDLSRESFVVQPEDNEHERANRFRYLGRLSQIRQRTYCPFCRLVLDIADRPSDQRAPSQGIDEDPTCYARWVVDGQEEVESSSKTFGEHHFRPKTRRILIYSEPQVFKDGYLVLLADDAPFREYFGRTVASADLLDPDQIRLWLHECETNHGEECEKSLVHEDLMLERKGQRFRVIDVHQMCLVEVAPGSRYVALSYLWGQGFKQIFTTSENLARLSKPEALSREKLPKTIKDAIKLTRMLGENYLWTDSLALIHDVGFQYHDDWVYARAALTVVAGSGKDANAGLPGVRADSRTLHQEIEEVKPGLKLMVSHLAEDYISTSQWDSRAWTFQERMLSRRCLLFVNGRIYYQCRRATYCEDIEMPQSNGWSLNSIDMPTRIFMEKPFVQYTSAVELYTQRNLTNPADILNGFEGVQSVLEKRIRSSIFYGILDDQLDSSLIWESTKLLRHRPNFPTWSWAGFIGEIQWKYAEYAQSWIEWDAERTVDGHRIPPQNIARIPPPIPRQIAEPRAFEHKFQATTPQLHFTTLSAMFKLTSPSLIHKSVVSPLRKRMTGPSALSTVRPAPTDPGLIRAGIADRDGQWCGTIDLNVAYMKMVGTPLEFLLMSRVNGFTEDEIQNWEGHLPDAVEDEIAGKDYGVYNVLLVSQRNGVRYREGLGRILTTCLDRALDPGLVWKDVILG